MKDSFKRSTAPKHDAWWWDPCLSEGRLLPGCEAGWGWPGERRARIARFWRCPILRESATSVIARLDKAGLVGEDDGLGAVAEAEFCE